MKEKIEASLRRAAEQLPQPDFKAVADTPVQPLEVHDYVTRQEPLPRRRPFRPAAAALALCVLALCVGLWSWPCAWGCGAIFSSSRSTPWWTCG